MQLHRLTHTRRAVFDAVSSGVSDKLEAHRTVALLAGALKETAPREAARNATRLLAASAMIVLSIATASSAHAEPPKQSVQINNWAEMRALFVRCWTVPKGTEGSVISFQFLLAPNGGLRGPPRVLGKALKGDEIAQRRFVESAYATLDRCLPINLTPGFKALMGEKLILLRLVNTPREPALNLGSLMTIFAEEVETE